MTENNIDITPLKNFENQQIRTTWNTEPEEWFVSITNGIAILPKKKDALVHWGKLKQRLNKNGNEPVTNCHELNMKDSDSKITRHGDSITGNTRKELETKTVTLKIRSEEEI